MSGGRRRNVRATGTTTAAGRFTRSIGSPGWEGTASAHPPRRRPRDRAGPASARPPSLGRTVSSERGMRLILLADLPVAKHNVLVRAQFLQAAGAAGVELVRAYADLRPQAGLGAVVEPRAGVDHHRRRIDAG